MLGNGPASQIYLSPNPSHHHPRAPDRPHSLGKLLHRRTLALQHRLQSALPLPVGMC